MNCPNCAEPIAPGTRFCPNCGRAVEVATRVEIRQDVKQNLGRVIGVQTEAIHGDVYGGDIHQVQVTVLGSEGRGADWRRFLKEGTPPYRFLSPYSTRDRALFWGRQGEIDEIVRRVGEGRIVIVLGPSGVGKTSLLAAGVIPKLAEYGALVIRTEEYEEPIRGIREAILGSSEVISIPLREDARLPEIARAAVEATGGSLVMVFDQFERLFDATVPSEARSAFLDELAESLDAVTPEFLRLILVADEGIIPKLGELEEYFPAMNRASYHILPLDRGQAKEAIEEPLRVLGYPVSFVGDLVDVEVIPDLDALTPEVPKRIHPPHLQIVCHRLYEMARRRRPSHIDENLYLEEAKGVDGILARYLQETLQAHLAQEQELAEGVLTSMASPGVERWVPPERLPQNGANSEQLSAVLTRLTQAALLVERAVNGRHEYAFVSASLAQEVRRLAGSAVEGRYQARAELERVWTAWLAREVPATRGQLRYLAKEGTHLTPRAVKVLLLLWSALVWDEPMDRWLEWLKGDAGPMIIQELEAPGTISPKDRSSRADRARAASLLGLGETVPAESEGSHGPVARSAVVHPHPMTRRTAALALTAPYGLEALDRLDRALRDLTPGRHRRSRKVEVRGTLADVNREVEGLNREEPALDRMGIWWWRARRRIFRQRDRILALMLGGAIGGGMALGLLRAALGIPAKLMIGVQFAIYFYWGAILGGALGLGMALAEPLLLRSPQDEPEKPSIWRFYRHPDRIPALAAAGIGLLTFGLAHMAVALLNGLSLLGSPLVSPMGFVAGLGLAAALYNQPRSGWRMGIRQWVVRLAVVVLVFILTHLVFVLAGARGDGISIAWTGAFYRAEFSRYLGLEAPRQWFETLALIDSALVGAVLTIGITAGFALAISWLARWKEIVRRAGG